MLVILTTLETAQAGSKSPPLNDNLGLATKMLWGVLAPDQRGNGGIHGHKNKRPSHPYR